MRVNDHNLNGAGAAGLGKANLDRTAPAGARSSQAGGSQDTAEDSVQLSGLGAKVRELSGGTPERAAKLDRLSQQVASGTYHVDPEAVSKGIVEDALGSGTGSGSGTGHVKS